MITYAAEPGTTVIRRALDAATYEDSIELQALIEKSVGGRFQRPIDDTWNNWGKLTGTGASYELKIVENVTNMHDAVIERAALTKFGSLAAVPYTSPAEAVRDLFPNNEGQGRAMVEFRESDKPTEKSKKLTAVFRDFGCGLTPAQIPRTIFKLGSSHKVDLDWLQGSFGMGGLTTYRNAKAVVLVTRRDPNLLNEGEEDCISVAVVHWERHGVNKSAFYLVDTEWKDGEHPEAKPFSIPAKEYPDFDPGTHLALVSYNVQGFHRKRLGDERTFDTLLNTRLFRPQLPTQFRNPIVRERVDHLRGLELRLDANKRKDRPEGKDTLPLRVEGTTYRLSIRFWIFSKRGNAGERRSFVAHDHCLLLTSNGQTQKHWTPSEFKNVTRLHKLHDRILVTVNTDDLPLEIRSSLFTADRTDTVENEITLQLEQSLVAFLNDWEELKEINSRLIRESISSRDEKRPTLSISRQISRALRMKGFNLGVLSSGDEGGKRRRKKRRKKRKPKKLVSLYQDPTTLEGPESISAVLGKTKSVSFHINALDDFIPDRTQLCVDCSHPEIGPRDIIVGSLHKGRIRVLIVIPENVDCGAFKLAVKLGPWLRSSGGTGSEMSWTCNLYVEEESEEKEPRNGQRGEKKAGENGSSQGGLVAVLWLSSENEEGWTHKTVGDVEPVAASILAEQCEEYRDLAELGETEIPTLKLNIDYQGLVRYLSGCAKNTTDGAIERRRDRYAVGVGVGLCSLFSEVKERQKRRDSVDEVWVDFSKEAVARGVLSNLTGFDEIAREAGIDT